MRKTAFIFLALLVCFSFSCKMCSTCGKKKSVDLFNGKDLAGWDYYLVKDDVKLEDVWSVKDGLLDCKGTPLGYLYTRQDFTNFRLVVEWRWAPGKKPGNSGVFLRLTEHLPGGIPKCIETQLKSGDAGSLYGFHGTKIEGPKERLTSHPRQNSFLGAFTALNKIEGNENEPGKWNKLDITVNGPVVTVLLNGKKVNEATGCAEVAGKIALQSEGGEIQFRTVKLTPIKSSRKM